HMARRSTPGDGDRLRRGGPLPGCGRSHRLGRLAGGSSVHPDSGPGPGNLEPHEQAFRGALPGDLVRRRVESPPHLRLSGIVEGGYAVDLSRAHRGAGRGGGCGPAAAVGGVGALTPAPLPAPPAQPRERGDQQKQRLVLPLTVLSTVPERRAEAAARVFLFRLVSPLPGLGGGSWERGGGEGPPTRSAGTAAPPSCGRSASRPPGPARNSGAGRPGCGRSAGDLLRRGRGR